MKEVLRELDESKLARDEVVVQSKDTEKRLQTLEAELLQLTEVCVLVCVCVREICEDTNSCVLEC